MSNRTGLDNVKKQIFSLNGNVSRMRFFISFIVVLPIMIGCFFIFLFSAVLLGEILSSQSGYYEVGIVIYAIASTLVFLFLSIVSLMIFSSFVIRRLNDLSLDRKFYFISFIPVFNVIFFIMLFFLKGVGDKEENSY
jgi:hypothetical protein